MDRAGALPPEEKKRLPGRPLTPGPSSVVSGGRGGSSSHGCSEAAIVDDRDGGWCFPSSRAMKVAAAGGWRPAALCVLLLALGGARAEFTRLSSRTVTTKYGALKGYIETPSPPPPGPQQQSRQQHPLQPVEVFLGVPYAAPPTGAMRFMPPVSPAHWSGVRMADRLAPVCPQRLPDIGSESEAVKRMPLGRLEYLRRLLPHLQRHSEDCLYLNIYTPAI
ncbi:hypothetical protein V5799_021254, partial [Amblyomma americanum]